MGLFLQDHDHHLSYTRGKKGPQGSKKSTIGISAILLPNRYKNTKREKTVSASEGLVERPARAAPSQRTVDGTTSGVKQRDR